MDQAGGDNLEKLQPRITLVTLAIESVSFVMLIVSGVNFLPAIAFTAKTTQPWSIQVPNVLPDLTQLIVLSVLRDRWMGVHKMTTTVDQVAVRNIFTFRFIEHMQTHLSGELQTQCMNF